MFPRRRARPHGFLQFGNVLVLLVQKEICLVDGAKEDCRGRIGVGRHRNVLISGRIVILWVDNAHGWLRRGRGSLSVLRGALVVGSSGIFNQLSEMERVAIVINVIVVFPVGHDDWYVEWF